VETEVIEQVQWSWAIEQALKISANGGLHILKADVARGDAQLWRCQSERNCAYAVTRIVDAGTHRELLIECFEGSGVREFIPTFINVARGFGMTVRADVMRDGLVRMLAPMGFKKVQTVLRAA
jgi:hypothetical protein